MSSPLSVGFIGGGNMCEALLKGLLSSHITAENKVIISEPLQSREEYLRKTYPGIHITAKNADVVSAQCDVVFVAVKPQMLKSALSGLNFTQKPLIISICAGVSLETLSQLMPSQRIVRVMPNTPALVGAGASAFCMGASCTEQDRALANKLLECFSGVVVAIDEKLIDAVTGLSGSGPAYFFLFIEALADGAVQQGLPRAQALKLAAQTCVGAGKMVLESGRHPGELKDSVCSPAGTTIAGVAALERNGFRSAAMEAVKAATERSRELSKI
ncbi:pyrroline carboxylate reductase, putative [Perkinsus marinus ATCC 50983]|uniref:Pyrroline-5-carboxylate reductase n=1 Tax=Perkinsus marinus (strain ATCC 50983 / TXsc) TaxID=423536 RepID=C5LTR7_PERM5|nr:pyrroline carboxylate reductase, putative [Perkinsus marinus ATCC 50983]EEQ99879.1 pyrroline carboxylate reductase, putative [Perkinsus marinus ATCC 50983]|eukprot:XP_002767162.1 pyrroline carboxylate reductase, putative [Perkinsus marinus ATCC 50983]